MSKERLKRKESAKSKPAPNPFYGSFHRNLIAGGVVAGVCGVLGFSKCPPVEQKKEDVKVEMGPAKDIKVVENPTPVQIVEAIRRLRSCLLKAVKNPYGTSLLDADTDAAMDTAGMISGDKRYVVRSGNVAPQIVQLEVTDQDKTKRRDGRIYRDFQPDGTVDEVLRGSSLQRAHAIATPSDSAYEFQKGLQIVADACQKSDRDLSVFTNPPPDLMTWAITGSLLLAMENADLKNIPPHELFNLLKKSPYFYPREYISGKGEEAPTIILIGENHSHPLAGWQQLDILREKIGVNIVEMEGWCGPEVDRKRGTVALNADTRLLQKLMDSKEFTMIGLEQEDLQAVTELNALKYAYDQANLPQNQNPKCSESSVAQLECVDFMTIATGIRRIKATLVKIGYNSQQLEAQQLDGHLQAIAQKFGMSMEELQKKAPMELREKIAADRVAESVKTNQARFRSVVVGMFHVPGMVKLLREHGFNILVLEDPIDYEFMDR